MKKSRLIGVVLAGYSILFAMPVNATTYLFDDFMGAASDGVLDGVTFTSNTALFDSHDDGIEYATSLFPSEGVIELSIRIDQVGRIDPVDACDCVWSAIIDSAGADARIAGDIMLQVSDSGNVLFTLAPVGGQIPHNQVQVTSSTSILDGLFHTIGVQYGSSGITLAIDGIIEDTDPFVGLRNTTRAVSLGDFTDRQFVDEDFAFSFVGEVDWVKSSTTLTTVPIPPAIYLFGSGMLGLIGKLGRNQHNIRRNP